MKNLKKLIALVAIFLTTGTLSAFAFTSFPVSPALFDTSLASPQQTGDTTLTMATAPNIYAGDTVCVAIDSNLTTQEYECGTASTTTTVLTGITRGLNFRDGTTTVAANVFYHRAGADVRITSFPVLPLIVGQLNGNAGFPSALTYTSAISIATSSLSIPYASWVAGMANVASTSAVNTLLGSNNTWSGTQLWNALGTFASGVTVNGTATFNNTINVPYSTASSSAVSVGLLTNTALSGITNASVSAKGISQIATPLQIASSTATGSTGAPLVISADNATSTYGNGSTSGLKVVVTQNNGKIDSGFIPNVIPTGTVTASTSIWLSTTTQNWTKPSGTREVCFLLIGGGAGGSARPGGGSTASGGAGGALLSKCFPSSLITGTVSIVAGGYGVGAKNVAGGEDGQSAQGTSSVTINGILYEAGGGSGVGNGAGSGLPLGGVPLANHVLDTTNGIVGGNGGQPSGGTQCASGGGAAGINGVTTGCTAPASYTGETLAGQGGSGTGTTGAGLPGTAYGGGGGPNNGVVGNNNGAQGVVRITAFIEN